MRLFLASSTFIALVGLSASSVGCFGGSSADDSTGDDAGKSDSGKKDSGADDASDDAADDAALDAGPVSLKNDLLPLMAGSCGLSSSCHGSPTGKQIYFGSKASPIAAATLYATLKKKSLEVPTMPYVTPGNPSKSYLVIKVEATTPSDGSPFASTDDLAKLTCPSNILQPSKDDPCGEAMPQGLAPWEDAAMFRAWVEQGALNN